MQVALGQSKEMTEAQHLSHVFLFVCMFVNVNAEENVLENQNDANT